MRCWFLAVIFLASSGGLNAQAEDSRADLSLALSLYKQGKFSKAYPLFADSARKHPGDSTAWLYAANCLYQSGSTAESTNLYDYVRQKFAGSNQAKLAEEMLKRRQSVVTPAVREAASARASASDTSAKSPEPNEDDVRRAITSGPADFSDLIEVVRPLFGHPPVSDQTVSAVRRAVKNLPPQIAGTLRQNGAKIYICTTLIDKEPSLKNREGRGYDGYTYKSCPGMFWNNRIYLCERTLDENDDSVNESIEIGSIVNTFYHECGHALDFFCDEISATEEFKHSYLLDCGKIDTETKSELAYYLQKSEAGQQECCGQLIGVLLGMSDKTTSKMKASFPLTLQLLREKIKL